MSEQRQFLQVVDADEARARWWAAARPAPLGREVVPLARLRGRVLAEAVAAPRDVPGFDRSNVDGYAVRAVDTYGASEAAPRRLVLRPELLACGVVPQLTLGTGEAVAIATGGVVPRGADAVVIVEDTEVEAGGPRRVTDTGFDADKPPRRVVDTEVEAGESRYLADTEGEAGGPRHRADTKPAAVLLVRRPVVPGGMISFAGSDITRGEVVLRPGGALGPRETGVLAAIGRADAQVFRRPRVGVLSTGDEIVAPGEPLAPGQIHDCNQTLLADACEELGAEVVRLGITRDVGDELAAAVHAALHAHACDLLLLSGGTSKGAGDLSFAAVAQLPGPAPDAPAICVHGVALKPGKPLCLAATRVDARVVPIAVLPGFPTSALFTFHEFVAPLLRALAGLPPERGEALPARLAHDVASERGRREYVLVQLLAAAPGPGDMSETPGDLPVALPLGKGSGSVTAFCRADGFVAVPRQHERLDAGERVLVRRTGSPGADTRAPDLLIIGSHCTGLEHLADVLHAAGLRVQLIAQGSQGGLAAAARGHCDVAPIHLLDPGSGRYNLDFVPPGCALVPGYGRMQGLVSRPGDDRFVVAPGPFALPVAVLEPAVQMVNRNRGSGTRVVIDELLAPLLAGGAARPAGYTHEARSHAGVVACVAQGRADWGVAIASAAAPAGLAFAPIREERYDFVIPGARRERPAVQAFLAALADPQVRARLRADGFLP